MELACVMFTAKMHYTRPSHDKLTDTCIHVQCMYHVDPLGQMECDGPLWAWLHTQAARYVEGESGEGARRFENVELCAGGVANKRLDVQISGCVLVREERDLDDIAELVGRRVARERERERERE